MDIRVIVSTLFAAALFASPAWSKDEGIYIGASAGLSSLEASVEDSNGDNVFDFDDEEAAYKVFGGWQISGLLAVEGGYNYFGQVSEGPFDTEVDGYNLFVVVGIPVGPLRVFAKGGGINWDADVSGELNGSSISDEDGTDLAAGVGLEFEVFSLGVRAEVEYFDVLDDLYLATVGVTYTF
jgi:hypothetical protein